jgi:hypothetical protein
VALLLYLSGAWAQEPPSEPKPADTPVVAPADAKDKPPESSPPIDLYLGSVKELLPQGKWDTILAVQPTDAAEEGDLPDLGHGEDVQVEGERTAPKVPSGIAGLFWAMRHPTQAWRVFAPAR